MMIVWDVFKFKGKKSIVVSSSGVYGGKNVTLEVLMWICTVLSGGAVGIFKMQQILNGQRVRRMEDR